MARARGGAQLQAEGSEAAFGSGLAPATGSEPEPTREAAVEAPVPRCWMGHPMQRRHEGAAGLVCDGACGRGIRRGEEWWCCERCDYDVC